MESVAKRAVLSAVRFGLRFPPAAEAARAYVDLKRLLEELRIDCVLDVGANRGQFAESLRFLGFAGEIISFEPVARDFAVLRSRFARDGRWHGFQIALGDKEEEVSMTVVPYMTVMNSILPSVVPLAKKLEREIVSVKRLDSVLPMALGSIATKRIFLKMDTQGYDLKCFEGVGGFTDDIVGLQSELSVQPIYEGMPHYVDSLRRYEATGFRLISLTEVSRRNGAVQEFNCLMRRSLA